MEIKVTGQGRQNNLNTQGSRNSINSKQHGSYNRY